MSTENLVFGKRTRLGITAAAALEERLPPRMSPEAWNLIFFKNRSRKRKAIFEKAFRTAKRTLGFFEKLTAPSFERAACMFIPPDRFDSGRGGVLIFQGKMWHNKTYIVKCSNSNLPY